MSMTHADNFYTFNVDKVFDKTIDRNGVLNQKEFDREMDKLRDEEINRLYREVNILEKEIVAMRINGREIIRQTNW